MALPDLIEIVPLDKPVRAEITVPGSKSITNRALILAALADGEVTLTGALWSEDTQVMTEALRTLGFDVRVENDPTEFCNRTITVKGLGGRIPEAGTAEKPLELFVGNAGTAARFLAAMVCLGNGVYHLHGVPRMHERPQASLFKALRELGYQVESANDKLPAVIHGQVRSAECGVRSCAVSIDESSQFASALFLSARHGNWDIKVVGDDDEEAPYVRMTQKLVEVFPWSGGTFQIEPDASGGSYFLGASRFDLMEQSESSLPDGIGFMKSARFSPTVTVRCWPTSGWQIDANFSEFGFAVPPMDSLMSSEENAEAEQMLAKLWGANWRDRLEREHLAYTETFYAEHEPVLISRRAHLGDSIMTAIVLSPLHPARFRFTDLGRLRVQECERVVALRTELTKCGAKVIEKGDTLTVYPSKLHGAEIETYNDHRMAMCFAILGLKVPGIKLKNPACVKKTFPNFFQKLATPPPLGLGVEIRDGRTGRKLEMDELFAD